MFGKADWFERPSENASLQEQKRAICCAVEKLSHQIGSVLLYSVSCVPRGCLGKLSMYVPVFNCVCATCYVMTCL